MYILGINDANSAATLIKEGKIVTERLKKALKLLVEVLVRKYTNSIDKRYIRKKLIKKQEKGICTY